MTLYEISVRQTRDLPVVSLFPHPASFRFHLTMDTLAFGYILPTTGWIRDFNPLETCAAGRTIIKSRNCCSASDLPALAQLRDFRYKPSRYTLLIVAWACSSSFFRMMASRSLKIASISSITSSTLGLVTLYKYPSIRVAV